MLDAMSRFSLLAICLLLCPGLSAREWTATDGRKLEAEFVSATDKEVKVTLANGQTSTLPLARLSEADQVWVHEQPDPCAEATQKPGSSISG